MSSYEMTEQELRSYQPAPVHPEEVQHVHLIGVCGTGMGTLAGMLKESGYLVTGSDQGVYPPMSTQLEEWGVEVYEGYKPEHLDPRPDLVVVGNACRPSNNEVRAAIAEGIPCTSMPRALHDFYLKDRHVVVVAGTHGKTTTTALTAWLLTSAGKKPGVLVGGVCKNFHGSFQLPESDLFVIEGDEYDSALFDKVPKFVHYNPRSVILTSVEFDHADIYDSIDEIKAAFRKLMEKTDPQGHLWVCQDYEHAVELAESARVQRTSYSAEQTSQLQAVDLQVSESGYSFEVVRHGEPLGRVELPMFGRFNVANALAAIGVALSLGVTMEEVQEGLQTFQGIRRRQEIYARLGELLLIDEFAHHPTAIRLTTEAIRERFPSRRIWGIFEPRSNTARRNHFQKDLPRCFDACNRVVFSQPFGLDKLSPEERLDVDRLIKDLQTRIDQKKLKSEAYVFPTVDGILSYVTAKARPDDVVVLMSNGGFGNLHARLKDALSRRMVG